MTALTKPPAAPVEDTPKSSEPMSTYVPLEVASCIREDASSDDRSESYIIARILKAYYAKRVAKMQSAQASQRRAA